MNKIWTFLVAMFAASFLFVLPAAAKALGPTGLVALCTNTVLSAKNVTPEQARFLPVGWTFAVDTQIYVLGKQTPHIWAGCRQHIESGGTLARAKPTVVEPVVVLPPSTPAPQTVTETQPAPQVVAPAPVIATAPAAEVAVEQPAQPQYNVFLPRMLGFLEDAWRWLSANPMFVTALIASSLLFIFANKIAKRIGPSVTAMGRWTIEWWPHVVGIPPLIVVPTTVLFISDDPLWPVAGASIGCVMLYVLALYIDAKIQERSAVDETSTPTVETPTQTKKRRSRTTGVPADTADQRLEIAQVLH